MANEITLTNEVRGKLIRQMMDVLQKYDHHPTEMALNEILDQWLESKAPIMAPFTSLENWVADKFMVVYSNDYERTIDLNEAHNFYYWIKDVCEKYILKESVYFGVFNYREIRKIICKYRDAISYLEDPDVNMAYGYKKYNLPELRIMRDRYTKEFNDKGASEYTKESKRNYDVFIDLIEIMIQIIQDHVRKEDGGDIIINEDQAELINHKAERIEGLRLSARVGQKITKVYLKLFRFFGIDNENEVIGEAHGRNVYSEKSWNTRWAKFTDSISPLKYKRHTIFSFNPIDYLRMSLMAHGQTSCHTIDKKNIEGRDSGNNYHGMHANGTISYMLDESSAVFYTIDAAYDGRDFEMEEKECRQMFHIGTPDNPFFTAGRLYPQSNDSGSNSLYKQIREFVQMLLSQAWEIPNLWNTKKMSETESSERRTLIDNYDNGAHYPDFFNFSEVCRLSKNKCIDESKFRKIHIGHQGICITCGGPNDEDGELSCCRPSGSITCSCCGSEIREPDEYGYRIDGNWYCEDCVFWCDYHECYEPTNEYCGETISGESFCYDALNYGDIEQCCECGDYFNPRRGDGIMTEDGKYFCCDSCAERNDYRLIDDEWTKDWEVCERCGETFRTDSMEEVDGHWYCEECLAEIETEEEAV